jgi:hypothetical protein
VVEGRIDGLPVADDEDALAVVVGQDLGEGGRCALEILAPGFAAWGQRPYKMPPVAKSEDQMAAQPATQPTIAIGRLVHRLAPSYWGVRSAST